MQTTTEIRALLKRLDGEPADAIESQTLECKPWDPNRAALPSQLREIRETVVAFANAGGGAIVVGIADRKKTRRDAIHGVGRLDAEVLRKAIYDGTDPRILVAVEEIAEPEGRLLLLHVPRGFPPHTTTEGVAKIRVGKESKPLTGGNLAGILQASGRRDPTGEPLPGASLADLQPEEIERLRRTIEGESAGSPLLHLSDEELLRNLGLAGEEGLALGAVLLLGRAPALRRWAPQHEIVFLRFRTETRYVVRREIRAPLLGALAELQGLLEAHLRIELVPTRGFQEITVPEVPPWTAREALLNALVHRDYFLREPVQVSLHPDRLEVVSPGGFLGGVGPSNILRHPPVRRNPLLAGVLQTIGLVNRAGIGVDRIFEEMLRAGKSFPRFEGDEAHVRLTLATRTHAPLARLVADETLAERRLELDDLIVLRAVLERGHADRWTAAERLQLAEEKAAERLVSLRARGYLLATGRGKGTRYRLGPGLSGPPWVVAEPGHGEPLPEPLARERVEAVLATRGSLGNAEVRLLTGYPRAESLRLLRALCEEGVARLQGRGRAARYVPGPRLRRARRRGKRR